MNNEEVVTPKPIDPELFGLTKAGWRLVPPGLILDAIAVEIERQPYKAVRDLFCLFVSGFPKPPHE